MDNKLLTFKGKVTLYHPQGQLIKSEDISFPTSMRAKNDYWKGSFGMDTEAVLTNINQAPFNNCTISEVNRVASAVKRVENITGAKMSQKIWDTLMENPWLYVHFTDERKRHINVTKLISVLNNIEYKGKCYCFNITKNKQYPIYTVTCKAVNGKLVTPSLKEVKAMF